MKWGVCTVCDECGVCVWCVLVRVCGNRYPHSVLVGWNVAWWGLCGDELGIVCKNYKRTHSLSQQFYSRNSSNGHAYQWYKDACRRLIYFGVLGLHRCSMHGLYLQQCKLSCSMWVPWPGVEPRPPAWKAGSQSPDHQRSSWSQHLILKTTFELSL